MIYLEHNELYHHGVKGQKWGVIRKRLRSVGRAVSTGGRSTARWRRGPGSRRSSPTTDPCTGDLSTSRGTP